MNRRTQKVVGIYALYFLFGIVNIFLQYIGVIPDSASGWILGIITLACFITFFYVATEGDKEKNTRYAQRAIMEHLKKEYPDEYGGPDDDGGGMAA
jgi:hypothetical protein